MGLIKIGMAELRVAKSPDVLETVGLGSCIAIILYDKIAKLGGMAHIMLPRSDMARDKTNKAKFADTAIDIMFDEMLKLGATQRNIRAKIFGGANMFSGVSSETLLNVGVRNAMAVQSELEEKGIKIVGQEVGGTIGRTVIFDTEDGRVGVKTVGGEERIY